MQSKRSLVSRKRISALRIFKVPAFRRHFQSVDVRKRLVDYLKTNLTPAFFERLEKFSGYQVPSFKIKSFVFDGHEFIIKNTKGRENEGFVEHELNNPFRQFIKLHQNHYRKNKSSENFNYILRTPKLIARIGNYLVLERIPHWIPSSKEEKELLEDAMSRAFFVFKEISLKSGLPKIQSCDLIPAGKHNGKIVLYAVYDHDVF